MAWQLSKLWRRWGYSMCLLLSLAALAACTSAMRYDWTDGQQTARLTIPRDMAPERVKLGPTLSSPTQTDAPTSPPKSSATPTLTANFYEPAKPDQALAQLSSLPMMGVLLMVAGVILLVGKTWLPVIPMELGAGLIGLGIGIIALPMLLDRYLGWLVAAGVIVGGISLRRWQRNREILSQSSEQSQRARSSELRES